MRISALSTFRKLYGMVADDLPPGEYLIRVANNFNVTQWEGTKTLILTTTNKLGGKNYFIAGMYTIVGVSCLTVTITLFILYMRERSQLASK